MGIGKMAEHSKADKSNNESKSVESVGQSVGGYSVSGIAASMYRLMSGSANIEPDNIIRLQRTIGNQAILKLVQRRELLKKMQRVDTTPATSHTGTELFDMTLSNFSLFAQQQVDWFNNTTVSSSNRQKLRTLLGISSRQYVLSGIGHIRTGTLLSAGIISGTIDVEQDKVEAIQGYGRAVGERIIKTPHNSPWQVIRWGLQLKILYASPAVTSVMPTTFKQEHLENLVNGNYASDLVNYFATCSPKFEAENGSDLASYILLRGEGRDPVFYAGTNLATNIKNFHRFQRLMLDRLSTNFQGADLPNNQRKPLTLILHTALDRNGAFHRDPNLTALIVNNNITALMIEGKETLTEVQGELASLASRYGKNNVIDQVMLAGHGDARSIELTENEGINLNDPASATRASALFDEILRNMSNDTSIAPHRRIVFNACLTGSNEVRIPLDPDEDTAQQEIRDHIATNSSLATHLQNRARAQGLTNIDVRGANGSFAQVQLIDGNDGLDIILNWDPSLTSDKMSYIENGAEPVGALRAVLECWAGTGAADPNAMQTRVFSVMQNRVNNPVFSDDWQETIIVTLYDIILNSYRTDGEKIRQMGEAAFRLDHMKVRRHARIAELARGGVTIGGSMDNEIPRLYTALSSVSLWGSTDYISLVGFEAWMMKDSSKQSNFMNALTPFTVATASEFIDDLPYISSALATLLPPGTTTPTRNQLLLACDIINKDSNNADARQFLLDVIGPGNRRFPVALNVGDILGNNPTEISILTTLGLVTTPSDGSGSTSEQDANIDLDGDRTNETYIEPLFDVRADSNVEITPRDRPNTSATVISPSIEAGRRLYIVGQTGAFYAIHNPASPRETIFILKSQVNLV